MGVGVGAVLGGRFGSGSREAALWGARARTAFALIFGVKECGSVKENVL